MSGKHRRTPLFYKAFFVLLVLALASVILYVGLKNASASSTETEGTEAETTAQTAENTAETETTVPSATVQPATEPVTQTEAEDDGTQTSEVTEKEFIDRVVEIALTEDREPVHNGKTKYGELFDAPYAAWCTEFVMYCIKTAEDELGTDYIGTLYPWKDYSGGVMEWYEDRDRFYKADGSYIPQKGDIIIFDTYNSGESDHTGLCVGTVTENGETRVITIEGNIPSDEKKVIRNRDLAVDEDIIVGYCSVVG